MQLKFVGRSSELRELDAIVHSSAAGRGALVVVSGEPGIGKSRLIREFIEAHPDDLIVTAGAHQSDQTPFAVWADIVAALDRKGIAVEKCDSTTAAREHAMNPNEDTPPPVDPNEPLGDTANRLIELINLSPKSAILILEQIQFMDPDSVRLLSHLSFALTNEPIMVICTLETDSSGRARVEIPPHSIEIELRGLTLTEVQALVENQYGDLTADAASNLSRSLHRLTAGYPKAIHSMLKSARDDVPDEHALLPLLIEAAEQSAAIGNTDVAYTMYARAADIAERQGDAEALAAAALGFAFPSDWRSGDTEALTRVVRAKTALDKQSPEDSSTKIVLDSVRAILEMRIPQQSPDGLQWAWVTRADVSQPISARAVDRARDHGDVFALLTALTSWRWTHRGPSFLSARTAVSTEALNLAISGDHPNLLIEACTRNVVDSLEQGDRQTAEKAITVAQWIADQTQDPSIQWRASLLSAATVGLDGNWEKYAELRQQALGYGTTAHHPGTSVGEALFQAQYLIHTLDFANWDWENLELAQVAKMHPLSSATWTFCLAHIGQSELATEWLNHTLTILDEESSLVASLSLLGLTALQLRDVPAATEILKLLGPWSGRVAIDADAGIIVGPVDLTLARLCYFVNETDRARAFAQSGNELKRQLTGEVSNFDRLIPIPEDNSDLPTLSDRQKLVLRLVGSGMTNQEIADELSFSLATVRRDTINLYKKLGVRGRAGAVQKAADLGLMD